MTTLRSGGWLDGDDEVAMLHRVALASVDYRPGRPVIGVAVTASDLNPCHGDVPRLVSAVSDGIRDAGATPVAFPAMSLGEDLMKPSAMLYRNLLAIEVEETIRSYPLDGIVVFAGCDKNVPAALMSLASADIPSLIALVGIRSPGQLGSRRLAAGTDIWRELEDRRGGRTSDSEWRELEAQLGRTGPGICNVMGTAVSMGLIAEMLGMAMPASATMSAQGDEIRAAAYDTGRRVVEMVESEIRPSGRMTQPAFVNAAKVLAAVGGSTNAIVHLLAVAGRLGLRFDLDSIESAVSSVPLLADVEPCGSGLAQDFHAAGASPTLVHEMADLLDLNCVAADGRTWEGIAAGRSPATQSIRTLHDPVLGAPTIAVLRGSLAPGGAVIKVAAASSDYLTHRGPAVVFEDYADMRTRLDDPELSVTADSVLVVRACGPVGAGMPEWGMAPIPKRLAEQGVRDMVRVSDGRMSGTSFGTVVLHVTPEAAVGGPLALVRDGDVIELDVPSRSLNLDVPEDELDRRRNLLQPPASPPERGWPALFRQHVQPASSGCDFDFLTSRDGPTRLVEPVIGRS